MSNVVIWIAAFLVLSTIVSGNPTDYLELISPIHHTNVLQPIETKINPPPLPKKFVEYPNDEHDSPVKYEFSYDVHDEHTKDIKSHKEEREGDVVKGSYSLIDSDGYKRIVEYTADDHHGFQAIVKREKTDIVVPIPEKKPPKEIHEYKEHYFKPHVHPKPEKAPAINNLFEVHEGPYFHNYDSHNDFYYPEHKIAPINVKPHVDYHALYHDNVDKLIKKPKAPLVVAPKPIQHLLPIAKVSFPLHYDAHHEHEFANIKRYQSVPINKPVSKTPAPVPAPAPVPVPAPKYPTPAPAPAPPPPPAPEYPNHAHQILDLEYAHNPHEYHFEFAPNQHLV